MYTGARLATKPTYAALGDDVEVVDADGFFRWGDRSNHVFLASGGETFGQVLLAQKGRVVFTVTISGVYFDRPEDFEEFLLPYLEQIADLGVPRIYFANGGSHLLHELAALPCEVIGLDWRADLAQAARILPRHALQGNLDPGVLMGPDDEIRRRTRAMIEQAPRTGYIANLGHGITPDIPVRAVEAFVTTVQEHGCG